jgi:plastocyanin
VGAQTGTPEPDVQKLTVVMKDFAFEPNVINLKKGVPVEVTLINQGSRRHDFSIVGDFSFESDVVPGGEKLVVRFTPDKVGTFQLVCSQIGHKANGMVASVIVS